MDLLKVSLDKFLRMILNRDSLHPLVIERDQVREKNYLLPEWYDAVNDSICNVYGF